MKYINQLKWRYATKQFDSKKKIQPKDLKKIKQAIQLAASSYGLQYTKFLILKTKPCEKL
jgi:nitroreductase